MSIPLNATTLLIMLGLVVLAVYALNYYRKRLLEMIPAPILQFLNAVGFDRVADGNVPREVPVIAALDNGVRSMLQWGMAEDAKLLQDLRYKLQVKAFGGTQPIVVSQAVPAVDTESLAKRVAELVQQQKGGAA